MESTSKIPSNSPIEKASLTLESISFLVSIGFAPILLIAALTTHQQNENSGGDSYFLDYKRLLLLSILTILPFSVLILSDLIQTISKWMQSEWATESDTNSFVVMKLVIPLVVIIPNLCVFLYGNNRAYSTASCALTFQLFFISHSIIFTAMKSDDMLIRRKWWFCLSSVGNGFAFICWCLGGMNHDTSRFWFSMGLAAHVLSGGVFVRSLYQFARETTKVAFAAPSGLVQSKPMQPKRTADSRWNSSYNYLMYLGLIIATWSITWIDKSERSGLLSNYYVMYLTAISRMVLGDRAVQASVKLVSMAADLNRGFVRFISHELLSHLNHLCIGLEQLVNESSYKSTDSSRKLILIELQQSCDSSVQILKDVLIFDGLRTDGRKRKERMTICVNGLIRRVVKELEPLVRIFQSHGPWVDIS